MRVPWSKASLVLFALGATAGTALDGIHTHSGTTAYPTPIFWMMAWWTPLLFGFAGLATGLAYPIVSTLTKRDVTSTRSAGRAAAGFAAFVGLYFASGYLPASNPVKLAVLALGVASLAYANARTALALGVALVAAFTGPAIEVYLVSNGAFRHLQPDLWGIPMWLPALYASGSLAFGVAGAVIVDGLRERSSNEAVLSSLTPSRSRGREDAPPRAPRANHSLRS